MTEDQKLEACARATHEANRAYCIAIGDLSQVPWDEAPEWQKSSAKIGVAGAIQGVTPEQSHESWLRTKEADGWRYGPVKDAEAKTHPCFVAYSDLPLAQRAKDDVFVTVARVMWIALSDVAGSTA